MTQPITNAQKEIFSSLSYLNKVIEKITMSNIAHDNKVLAIYRVKNLSQSIISRIYNKQ